MKSLEDCESSSDHAIIILYTKLYKHENVSYISTTFLRVSVRWRRCKRISQEVSHKFVNYQTQKPAQRE